MSKRAPISYLLSAWLSVMLATPIRAATLDRAAPAGLAQPVAAPQGKIVSIQGSVDHTLSGREHWDPAKVFESLYVDERVRTGLQSRTAILFIDETQVKLNAEATLTVKSLRKRDGGSTTFELLNGEGWFRTKNPVGGVTVATPTASATLRGTEINVAIRGAQTVLTVTEGAAEFSNPFGTILVSAGEEATATPGQPPTKRVLLTPDDAVQWSLYYPATVAWHDLPAAAGSSEAGFARLKGGDAAGAVAAFQPTASSDVWSRIGLSMAYIQLGQPQQARAAVAMPPAEGADAQMVAAYQAQRAAAALAGGGVSSAREAIAAALAVDPSAARPLALLSTLELTQNHRGVALDAALSAVGAHPESVAALVAMAEATEAGFDLPGARRYLDRALALDAGDVRALVDRARLRFGAGDTPGAERDQAAAAVLAPSDALVRSLGGFIRLAQGKTGPARADFEAAIHAESELGEPHLGLGLLDFRERQLDEGLLEMLTATLLDPEISLYQSYLGKAYYQLHRVPEGLAALASAKRLDPRDPTPWLYSSFFLRDRYRQVEALDDLRQAIKRNDNRAVYRSRLLLDRDLATKNVSLAEVYRELGFDAWGASEAQNSLEADTTNASAHLFLADAYGQLPDRTQAVSGELLQYFLYAPVNLNSFNNFAEYTALLEQPLHEQLLTSATGTPGRTYGRAGSRFGNERFAYTAYAQSDRLDGSRPGRPDAFGQGFVQGKVALDPASDMFFRVTGTRDTTGSDRTGLVAFGLDTPTPVFLRQITPTPDPTVTNRSTYVDATLGFKHAWSVGSALTAAADYTNQDLMVQSPLSPASICGGLDLAGYFPGLQVSSSATDRYPGQSYTLQLQQVTRLSRHQVTFGGDTFRARKQRRCNETISIAGIGPILNVDASDAAHDRATTVFAQDDIELPRRLHATVGMRYVSGTYGDVFTERQTGFDGWNPYAGLSLGIAPWAVVRVAALRNTNTNFTGARISPLTVAGFLFERNETPATERNEGDASLEITRGRAFVAARTFVRTSTTPAFLAGGAALAGTRDHGASAYVNWIVTRRLTIVADDQFARSHISPFTRTDNQIRVGVNLVNERGWTAQVRTAYLTQRFDHTAIAGLPRTSVPLTDASFGYEFARKRGFLSLSGTNLFARPFQVVIENLTVEQPQPRRRLFASLRWRL